MKFGGYFTKSIDDLKIDEELSKLVPENTMSDKIKNEIQKYGFLYPVLIDQNGFVIDGYTRTRIAKELGIKEVPVIVYIFDSPEERMRSAIQLNVIRRHLTHEQIEQLYQKYLSAGLSPKEAAKKLDKELKQENIRIKNLEPKMRAVEILQTEAPELFELLAKYQFDPQLLLQFYLSIKEFYDYFKQLPEEKKLEILRSERLLLQVEAEPALLKQFAEAEKFASSVTSVPTTEQEDDDNLESLYRGVDGNEEELMRSKEELNEALEQMGLGTEEEEAENQDEQLFSEFIEELKSGSVTAVPKSLEVYKKENGRLIKIEGEIYIKKKS
ncbi:putative ParBc domain protein [Acidianus two-tailed virus 2]|nr:putative ParBc domain protein [Acidianus two-tailed virus 2]